MASEASKRLNDASILSATVGANPDSGYLLELLAFELLLKAVVRIHGKSPAKDHFYDKLFDNLPERVRLRILETAADRMTTAADYRCLDSLLSRWSQNFIDLRYPYERYEQLSEEEYQAKGAEWVKRGAPLAEADFVYHPSELHGMVFALQQEVQRWLAATP